MKFPEDQKRKMIEASGAVKDSRPLVVFLYLLMRNETVPGAVEDLVQQALVSSGEFCNGWLAQYAGYIADRLEDGNQVPPL